MAMSVTLSHVRMRELYGNRGLSGQVIITPKSQPTAEVTPMARAPQNVTRAAPAVAGAPPALAARAPRPASDSNDVAVTTGVNIDTGAMAAVSTGSAAPMANVAADAAAACSGRALVKSD